MEIKDKFDLEHNITSAATKYAYDNNDKDFTCVVRVKCNQGRVSANILGQDANIEDIVLIAVQEFFNTDNPKVWAANNTTAYEISKFSAQLAQILKPTQKKKGGKRC